MFGINRWVFTVKRAINKKRSIIKWCPHPGFGLQKCTKNFRLSVRNIIQNAGYTALSSKYSKLRKGWIVTYKKNS
jgi:hypothetical protein